MKSLYRITNKRGITLCFQVAYNASEALQAAKFYGFVSAVFAEFVRAD